MYKIKNMDAGFRNWCDNILESEKSLAIQIATALPILRDNSVDDLKKVQVLRSYVHQYWPGTTDQALSVPYAYWEIEPLRLWNNGLKGTWGGACGPISWVLMKIYSAFGLDAWIYNFGNPEGIGTHVITLVNVYSKVIVQDAYLNSEIVTRSGRILDIRDALTKIKSDAHGDISVKYQKSARQWLSIDSSINVEWVLNGANQKILLRSRKNYPPYHYVLELSDFDGSAIFTSNKFKESVEDFLRSKELSPTYQNLMLFPINVTGKDGIAISSPGYVESDSQELFNNFFQI